MTEEKQINLNLKTVAFGIGLFFGITLLLTLIYFTKNIIALVFIAYLIAIAMANPVNWLHSKTKWSRGLCGALIYILFIALIVAGFALIIPPLVSQITELIKNFDLAAVFSQLNQVGIDMTNIDSLIKELTNLSKPVFTSLANIFSQTFQIFTMLILSFHLVTDSGTTYQRIKAITKNEPAARSLQSFSDLIKNNLGGWLRGELSLMLIIGLTSFIAFSLIGVPYALPLAVLAGFLELVPNLGPILAAIPAVALALTLGPVPALITLVVCIVIQQLENIFIVPRVMKSAAGVNPMVSIVAILIGFQLLGIAGALLAIPTYILCRTAYTFFIRDKRFSTKSDQ